MGFTPRLVADEVGKAPGPRFLSILCAGVGRVFISQGSGIRVSGDWGLWGSKTILPFRLESKLDTHYSDCLVL